MWGRGWRRFESFEYFFFVLGFVNAVQFGRFVPQPTEVTDELSVVLEATRFEDRLDHYHVHRSVQPRSLMEDVLHTRPHAGDRLRELGDAARPVAHRNGEPDEAAVRREAPLYHTPQHRDIDVAAAQWNKDLFALEVQTIEGRCHSEGTQMSLRWHSNVTHLQIQTIERTSREHRRETGRASSLDDHLLALEQPQHGQGHGRLVHRHYLVHPMAGDGEGMCTDLWNSQTVGEPKRLGEVKGG